MDGRCLEKEKNDDSKVALLIYSVDGAYANTFF